MRMSYEERIQCADRLKTTLDVGDLLTCELVTKAVFENLTLKLNEC